jgi:hypothetical protein
MNVFEQKNQKSLLEEGCWDSGNRKKSLTPKGEEWVSLQKSSKTEWVISNFIWNNLNFNMYYSIIFLILYFYKLHIATLLLSVRLHPDNPDNIDKLKIS